MIVKDLLFICLFLFSGLNLNTRAESLLPAEKINQILTGQQAMFNGQWDVAKQIYGNLYQESSDNPAGCLFQATVLQAQMIDREENLYGELLKIKCDSTKLLCENKLAYCTKQDSALCYLFLGHQYAYLSLWEARFGSKLSALNYGFKAKGEYRRGLEADSTLYDLYLGLGSYHYWKSAKSGFFRWIRLFKDEREKGIEEIKLATEKSFFSKDIARSALVGIYINEKKYDSAIINCEQLYLKYPNGNSFLWPLGECYFKLNRCSEAFKYYDKLFERLIINQGNYFNVIETVYLLKECCENMKQPELCDKYIKYLESNYENIPKNIRRKQKSRIANILGR